MLGAANSLLALVLDRRREIGLMRYLGAAGAQIRRMILMEAGLLGLLAGRSGWRSDGAFAGPDLRHQQAELRLDHPVSSPVALLWGRLLLVWSRHGSGRPLPGAVRRAAATRSK